MSSNQSTTVTIIREDTRLPLSDFCRLCQVDARRVVDWVEEGLIRADAGFTEDWRLPATELSRARRAARLRRTFGADTHTLTVMVEMAEELAQLRRRVQSLERLFD